MEAANLSGVARRASMGCWLEREAVAHIEYLKAENRLLRSRLGRRRLLFSDAERRTLTALAKEIGTKALRDLDRLSPQRPYCVGIEIWSHGNGHFSNDADLADPAPRSTSSNSSCGWLRRIRVRATHAFAVPCSSRRQGGARYDSTHSEGESECLSKLIPIGAPMLRRAFHRQSPSASTDELDWVGC
jgi:hypothetical protein